MLIFCYFWQYRDHKNLTAKKNESLNDLNSISPYFVQFPEDAFVKTLLYGNSFFDKNEYKELLETSIRYILESKRFSGGLQ